MTENLNKTKNKGSNGKLPQAFFDLTKQENLFDSWREKIQMQKTTLLIQINMHPFLGSI